MSPLDRKLGRDLWRIKGQAGAIGLVVAVGVMMLVMMSGLVTSLDQTRLAYYERYRLADIFAPVVRAPDRAIARLSSIPGIASAEGRVTGAALIDLPGSDLPLQARAVSLPDFGAAIQPANRPFSVSAFINEAMNSPSCVDGSQSSRRCANCSALMISPSGVVCTVENSPMPR